MLNGANPDEAVSARGPIAIRYRSPSFSFLKSRISTEQFYSIDSQKMGSSEEKSGSILQRKTNVNDDENKYFSKFPERKHQFHLLERK